MTAADPLQLRAACPSSRVRKRRLDAVRRSHDKNLHPCLEPRAARLGKITVVRLGPVNGAVHKRTAMMKCSKTILTFLAFAFACSRLTAAPIACANVMDYGAVGNGKVDDAPAIQKALNAAVNQGGICFLPAGSYRLNSSLTVPSGVTLKGSYDAVPHPKHPIGTVLHLYGGKGNVDAQPAIVLDFNASIRNVLIHYPEQRAPPEVVPYPWTIQIRGQMCQVIEVGMTNPYRAIDVGTHENELHVIRDVYACPLNIGIYIDRCSDVGRLENVHFNPNFWKRSGLEPKLPAPPAGFSAGEDAYWNGILQPYLKEHLIGFKIGRTDWEYISNCFVIFAKQGFLFDDFGHGAGNALVTQSGSDIGPVAVQVNKTQTHSGVQFSNCQFMSTVRIGAQNTGPVKISNSGFWVIKETREQVVNEGSGTVILNGCHFRDWDVPGRGDPCIRVNNGRLILSQCDFSRSPISLIVAPQKNAVSLEPGLVAGTVVGCLFHSDTIADTSKAKVEMAANVFEPAAPAAVLGNRTLRSVCTEVDIPVEQVVAILKRRGLRAGPDDTIKSISEGSGMSLAELFTLVAENL